MNNLYRLSTCRNNAGLQMALAAVLLLGGTACAPLVGQTTTACITKDPDKTYFITTLRIMYDSVGADSVAWKANGYPFATGAAISLVTSKSTCSSALAAYNRQSRRAVTQVLVAKLGSTGYVVMSPQDRTGEWGSYMWFDTKWSFKGTLAG
jgi:hypothetical protein